MSRKHTRTATSREAARCTIEETQIIPLSADDQRAVAAALLNPPFPNAAMIHAAKAYRSLIKASDDGFSDRLLVEVNHGAQDEI